jgi:AcrR family transcriptional regulator
VTFDELATSAGVSRSTFLRHFRTKEDAVLFVFDLVGETVASALASSNVEEPRDRLPAAIQMAAEQLVRVTPELRAVMELIEATPELRSGLFAKLSFWLETALPSALASMPDHDPAFGEARLACGFACLTVALRRWSAAGASETLDAVLERTLAALSDRSIWTPK